MTLLEQGFPNVVVVGFLDDNDDELRGRVIRDKKVLGGERDLNTVHAVHHIHQIWTTFEPDGPKHRRLEKWCRENDVKLVMLPAVQPFAALHEEAPARQGAHGDEVYEARGSTAVIGDS